MTNNDILRRLRYSFELSDQDMIEVFAEAEVKVDRSRVTAWLKSDEAPGFYECTDVMLATFLNGFINGRRGRRDGPLAEPEQRLTNNMIFRKLKIALDLQADDILALLDEGGIRLSKHELSAFFRKPDHKHYRSCKDQVLRKFLQTIQNRMRPTE